MGTREQAAFQRRFKAAYRDYGAKSRERYVNGFLLLGIHPLSWQPLKPPSLGLRCTECQHFKKHKDRRSMVQTCCLQSKTKKPPVLPFAESPFNSLPACEEYIGD